MSACACSDELPDELRDYRTRCERMNCDPIPAKADDPHDGVKHVYACDIDSDVLAENERPFPDGVTIVKESRQSDRDYVWLVAVAEKRAGRWHWKEYTRNFSDEEFRSIVASESVCINCHKKVEASDFIYTFYDAGPECTVD